MNDGDGTEDNREEKIGATFRNGSLTVIGIVAGFSLSFIGRWAANPLPWQHYDILAVAPLLVGIALQVKALTDLLSPQSLYLVKYNRARRIFLYGMMFMGLGITVAIVLDVAQITKLTFMG